MAVTLENKLKHIAIMIAKQLMTLFQLKAYTEEDEKMDTTFFS